jgi:mannosyl-oligosaccharide alpha-1,2-mannosidase
MILMDLRNEYDEVKTHVTNLNFEGRNVPFFETIIRYLGGLLSAYSLTQDIIFLSAADDLAKALLPAFDTPSHLPAFAVDLTHSSASAHFDHPEKLSLAEIGSFQLEYKYLAHLTQRRSYFTKVGEFIHVEYSLTQSVGGVCDEPFESLPATVRNVANMVEGKDRYTLGRNIHHGING